MFLDVLEETLYHNDISIYLEHNLEHNYTDSKYNRGYDNGYRDGYYEAELDWKE